MKKNLNVIIGLIIMLPTALFASNEFNMFAPMHKLSRSISHNLVLQGSDTIIIDNGKIAIKGFSITADIIQKTERSFVRVILEDIAGQEFLVGECSRIFNDKDTVSWSNYSEETCNLDSIFPKFLKIIAIEASVILHNVNIFESTESSPQKALTLNRDSLQLMQIEKKVEAINRYNINHNLLWRAGITSVAMKPYAERKQLLGITNDSCNTAGFEYYKSGIFVMPGSFDNDTLETRSLNDTNVYVESFDWRNRHGKNWITPSKTQIRLTCWAFAAASVVESYINLYFNRNLNYDLSELDFVMNASANSGLEGGFVNDALYYTKNCGVVKEDCYPFVVSYDTIEKCFDPEEIIKIEDYNIKYYVSDNEIKQKLIKHPVSLDLFWQDGAGHSVLFVGYNKIAAGDSIMLKSYLDINPVWTIVNENSDYVDKTMWIIKNSYGKDWGIDGYAYIITNNLKKNIRMCSLNGAISSLLYKDNDILCTDNDGDGYYYWGVGEKPEHCPAWALEEADGDDNDYTKGPMNKYGYCQENLPQNDTIFVTTDTTWDERIYLYKNVVICKNATLLISNIVTFYKGTSITIADGGQLIADNCSIDNVILKTEPGSKILLKNNGIIKHNKEVCFTLSNGSELQIISGMIE